MSCNAALVSITGALAKKGLIEKSKKARLANYNLIIRLLQWLNIKV